MQYKQTLIHEGYQACGLPGQCTPVQIDVEILREETTQGLALRDTGIAWRQKPNTFQRHNGQELLERCVGNVLL